MNFADQLSARRAQIMKQVANVAQQAQQQVEKRRGDSGDLSSNAFDLMNGPSRTAYNSNDNNQERPDWLDGGSSKNGETPAPPTVAETTPAAAAAPDTMAVEEEVDDNDDIVDVTDTTPAIMVEDTVEVDHVPTPPSKDEHEDAKEVPTAQVEEFSKDKALVGGGESSLILDEKDGSVDLLGISPVENGESKHHGNFEATSNQEDETPASLDLFGLTTDQSPSENLQSSEESPVQSNTVTAEQAPAKSEEFIDGETRAEAPWDLLGLSTEPNSEPRARTGETSVPVTEIPHDDLLGLMSGQAEATAQRENGENPSTVGHDLLGLSNHNQVSSQQESKILVEHGDLVRSSSEGLKTEAATDEAAQKAAELNFVDPPFAAAQSKAEAQVEPEGASVTPQDTLVDMPPDPDCLDETAEKTEKADHNLLSEEAPVVISPSQASEKEAAPVELKETLVTIPPPKPTADEPSIKEEASGDQEETIVDPPTPLDVSKATFAEPEETVVEIPPQSAASADSPDETRSLPDPVEQEETIVEIPPPRPPDDCEDAEKDILLVELQSSLQEQMNQRAEAENRARRAEERAKNLEQQLAEKGDVESELERVSAALANVSSEKSNLEAELEKLRQARDEHERKEIVLSNRLNAAKKKEAAKANAAEQLQDEAKALRTELEETKKQLSETLASKQQAGDEAQSTTHELQERLKQTETSLADERRLNEERKKKMKTFIETKQEELRQAKVHSEELNQELEQTNRLLREHNARWKQLHAQWVQSQTRNRELQRDLNRTKKDSDTLHKMGDKMEMKMAQSAQETEEHKNKRLTAKHELMTILRTLEAEREVNTKLRDSIKFTFTPKALSQQQLLRESLQELEAELNKLSRRLGKPLPPATEEPLDLFSEDLSESNEEDAAVASGDNDNEGGDTDEAGNKQSRKEADSAQLLSNLENETQRVSRCIMALSSNIERMRLLLDESGDRTCITVLADLVGAGGLHLRNDRASREETTSITGSSSPRLGLGSRRYGQLPTTAT